MIRLLFLILLLTACNDNSNYSQNNKKKAVRHDRPKLSKKALVDKVFADYDVKSRVSQVVNEFQSSLPADKAEKLKDINKDQIEKNLRNIFFTNLTDENVALLDELVATYGIERIVKFSEQVSLLNNVLKAEVMRQLFRPGMLNPRAAPPAPNGQTTAPLSSIVRSKKEIHPLIPGK